MQEANESGGSGSGQQPATGEAPGHDSDRVAFVRFRVGGFPLAAEAGHVARVSPVPERTRLPGSPPPVVGLGYLGGAPTVLLTLHDRLDVAPEAGDRRAVVLRGPDHPVGVLADAAGGTVSVPVERLTPPGEVDEPFAAATAEDDLFRAVCSIDGERVYVLSPPAVAALAVPGER
jgi:chemotaxis signal transduction protein